MASVSPKSGNEKYLLSIPIDIQVHKLLDWLIDRKHCTRDWHNKYKNAIKDIEVLLDNNEIKNDLGPVLENINIYSISKALSLLECKYNGESNEEKKNKLKSITKAFENARDQLQLNGTGLAQMSSFLSQIMVHQIPSLKKNVDEVRKSVEFYEKSASSKDKLIEEIKASYKSKNTRLGLYVSNVDDHLNPLKCYEMANNEFATIMVNMKSIAPIYTYYIKSIQNKYKDQIDFRLYFLYCFFQSVGIETVAHDLSSDNIMRTDIETFREALNKDRSKVLHESKFRQQLIVELTQLLYFLKQRLNCINSSYSVINSGSCDIGEASSSTLTSWMQQIQSLIDSMETDSLVTLILINSSLSFRHRIETEIASVKSQYDAAIRDKFKAERNYGETLKEYVKAEAQFKKLLDSASTYIPQIKSTISGFYNSRRVNLISETNKYLTQQIYK